MVDIAEFGTGLVVGMVVVVFADMKTLVGSHGVVFAGRAVVDAVGKDVVAFAGKAVVAADKIVVVADTVVDKVVSDRTEQALVVEDPVERADHSVVHFDRLGLEILLVAPKPAKVQLLVLHDQPFCW